MRKDDNDLTLRLLAINGNLSATMNLDALKEIRAPLAKRNFQNTVTGMRDFPGAIQELDEVWRAIFQSGLIRPAVRVASLEECASPMFPWRSTRTRRPSSPLLPTVMPSASTR